MSTEVYMLYYYYYPVFLVACDYQHLYNNFLAFLNN